MISNNKVIDPVAVRLCGDRVFVWQEEEQDRGVNFFHIAADGSKKLAT